ncbi:nitrilase family protein-like protein [Ascobolus immersus RN42]|uniref:Nitrilase family protein-like protein n=1 Tax=Ascobolus immersus RN42 TaxID=1160509 RepID=A0A3N4IJF0_ASCIM|nr:nitrilase family protein-like protein [Ascobolus immersus RN42]
MATATPLPLLKQDLKVGLVQMLPGSDKANNLVQARNKIRRAASMGAKLVVLPECFNSPYGTDHFPEYAEVLPEVNQEGESETFKALKDIATEHNIYLLGGSIPEREETSGKLYNTSLTFSPNGTLIGKHRKVHLFDISIPGKIHFQESLVLSPGKDITIIDLPEYGKIGVGICYDIRFPELAMISARKHGVFAMFYPGAFNLTTGPLHWELLARSRATDNQIFVGVVSPARSKPTDAGYKAYGHSMMVDPNGEILCEALEGEELLVQDLEAGRIEEVRQGIPVYSQRRWEVYPDVAGVGKEE